MATATNATSPAPADIGPAARSAAACRASAASIRRTLGAATRQVRRAAAERLHLRLDILGTGATGDRIACPACGSEDVRASSPARVYQRVSFTADHDLDYEPYDSDDVEFDGPPHLLCMDCVASSGPYWGADPPKEWTRDPLRARLRAAVDVTVDRALLDHSFTIDPSNGSLLSYGCEPRFPGARQITNWLHRRSNRGKPPPHRAPSAPTQTDATDVAF